MTRQKLEWQSILFVGLALLLVNSLVSCSPRQPLYSKASGEPVNLVNNSQAHAHTWQEVVDFLQSDNTDRETYTPEHGSGFFAERLHNRAEYKGFRTAFVVVHFEPGEAHALNAFETIDCGTVYVDCTNTPMEYMSVVKLEPIGGQIDLEPITHWDKVAYLVEGKRIGFISLEYVKGNFSYEWYNNCRARWVSFKSSLTRYNRRATAYNQEFARFGGHQPGMVSRQATEEWQAPLIGEWDKVRGFAWAESDSYVTGIEVYW